MNDRAIDTYLSKQENLVVEFVRRLLQAETKIVMLESAVQEANKRAEESKEQYETCKTTLDQTINGLAAVTIERDALNDKVQVIEKALNNCIIDRTKLSSQTSVLNTLSNDYASLKENYDLVLAQLNKCNTDEKSLPPKKKGNKKQVNQEQEWSYGE
jgi:hypothetical protein